MPSFRDDLFIKARLCRSGMRVQVRGIPMYYETYGDGPPLLLLHGGMSCLDTFRCQIADLSKHFCVILAERPGHGHTPDRPGPFTYEEMAEDTIGLMQALKIPKAQMIGYSDGANLIIPLALKKPEMIEKFISVGGNFHFNGLLKPFQDELLNPPEEDDEHEAAFTDRNYEKYSPDGPAHFEVVWKKIKELWLKHPAYTQQDLMSIKTPALIMAGDQDVISLEHTAQFQQALVYAQLCIVPGTTHGLLKEKPEIVNKILLDFLLNPFPFPEEEKQ